MQPNDYLFDPEAPADDAVVALEEALRPFRYDPGRHPLALRARGRAQRFRPRRLVALAAAAAAALFISALGLRAWIWSWPDGHPWRVVAAPAGADRTLAEGERLEVGVGERTVVRIARIGRMTLEPGTELRLESTGGVRHRLSLDRGSISLGVWAPPFSVAIRTPAGLVFDMGCAFDLEVVGSSTEVRVSSGWVQLENPWGEVLVPEGASGSMREGSSPLIPIFDDASDSFRRAVRRFEARNATPEDLEAIRIAARPRDAYTILLLARRAPEYRGELIALTNRLAPAPSAAALEGAARGERRSTHEWIRSLALPPPKGWVRNWRDAFGP